MIPQRRPTIVGGNTAVCAAVPWPVYDRVPSMTIPILLMLGMLTPYELALLEVARNSISRGGNGDYEVAVVTAQMAAEIASEQVITAYLERKQVPELVEPLAGLASSYSLSNDRVLKLYNALTGDLVQQEPFWQAYKEHARRRGRIVHESERTDKAAAEASVVAVEQLILHLHAVFNRPAARSARESDEPPLA